MHVRKPASWPLRLPLRPELSRSEEPGGPAADTAMLNYDVHAHTTGHWPSRATPPITGGWWQLASHASQLKQYPHGFQQVRGVVSGTAAADDSCCTPRVVGAAFAAT
ncbi:hypothetical protein PWT90_01484 [Aphanocladium album]|nr:hypothetical protein PWT90_01484 [Aphanocladium album]